MKIILKQDVDKLGSLGDELEVKRGYARNYLIPQGFAVPVTRGNVKQIENQRKSLALKRADAIEKAKDLAAKLDSAELVFNMKSADGGKLFGSVTLKSILDELAEKGIELDRKMISLSSPIKTLGEHSIFVKLHSEVTSNLLVKVVPEKVVEEDEAKSEESSEEAPVSEEAATEE